MVGNIVTSVSQFNEQVNGQIPNREITVHLKKNLATIELGVE
jgi:hypothetical protein